MSQILDSLKWRYATKKFDPTKKIPDADVNELLEALRLAPSSYGLQPWTFLVITNDTIRKELRKEAWDQSQITDASHLIVLCAKTALDPAYVDHFIESHAKNAGSGAEAFAGLKKMVSSSIGGRSPEEMLQWNQKQVYIALGMLLETASLKQIDNCPMEGFSAEGFDRILGLKEKGLTATVVCALGYRNPDDEHAKHPKMRFPTEEVIVKI